MSEQSIINQTQAPLTVESLADHFSRCGLQTGQTIIVHTSLRSLGWVIGGPQALIEALFQAVGAQGTVMMPTQTWKNLDPASGVHGKVPQAWWPAIRSHWPPYDAARTPSIGMGIVAELFRTYPGTQRSNHPTRSFAASGANAHYLLTEHRLEEPFGETSPVGRLYELDGHILLIGVDHSSNTSLHLAEHRASYPSKRTVQESSAMLENGKREWISYSSPDLIASHDFAELGNAYEAAHQLKASQVGNAQVHFLRQRPLVDWAVKWLEQHRH